ncbi:MAG: hypothetical protein AB8E82_17805 [Aureispira sp.]
MLGLDLLFYTCWAYLALVILVELFLFDLPVKMVADNKEAPQNKALKYYLHRGDVLPYKIVPIFCLGIIIALLTNLVYHYQEFLISALLLFVLAGTLVVIQTKKNVGLIVAIKKDEASHAAHKAQHLQSILEAHAVTLTLLIGMLLCYAFKF